MSQSRYPLPNLDLISETYWIDQIGDFLEAQGVPSGCIFEWGEFNLRPDDLEPGGVVVSTLPPGQAPTHPSQISDVYVRRLPNGMGESIVRMSGTTPLFLSGWATGEMVLV